MSSSIVQSYNKLLEKEKRAIILSSAISLLRWDMETKMPPKGIELRSQQLALLTQLHHKMVTDPEIGKLLLEILKSPEYESLGQVQKRNIYLIKKEFEEQTKLPEKLVVEIAKQEAITTNTWKKAKASKNYKLLKPELEKLMELEKEAALILKDVKQTKTSYDALIDIYEPKMSSETIAKIFNELKNGLIKLIDKCISSNVKMDESILRRRVPIEVQRKISELIADFVGYDIKSPNAKGRIDESEHPFTDGYYDDVRITTHYYENNFISSVFSVLHECGHALYDTNLNHEWMYQPVGEACSTGIHESQSRFVENIVGRSRDFWTYFLPAVKKITGTTFLDVNLDQFIHLVNIVKPSKIRVEADEVTYCLHVIIRFEIERELFADKLTVGELPIVWNQKYMEYLGVEIENDSEGVMQDIHWPSGSYGYFPTYALGNIYSGQILEALKNDLPGWRREISNGRFDNVRKWLKENIHRHGRLYDPADLIKMVTGSEVDSKPYLRYLEDKYSDLYGF